MSDASIIVVPGAPAPARHSPGLLPDAALPVVLPVLVLLGTWYALRGRRRRALDPRELAFRRMAHALGLGRRQVRALRREATERGLASPVGLTFSPTLIEEAVRRHAPAR